MSRTPRIVSLDALRGLVAVGIVCYHYGWMCMDPVARGGVAFFFMLSGFMLQWRHGGEIMPWTRFMAHRARLVYPLHYVALALLLAMMAYAGNLQFDGDILVPQLLLVQSWLPGHERVFGYNSVSWFLSSLLVCYALFPVLSRLLCRGSLRAWVATLVALTVALAVTLCVWRAPAVYEYIYVNPFIRVDFLSGMVLAEWCRRHPASDTRHATVLEVVAVLTLVAVFSAVVTLDALEGVAVAPLWWPALLLMIYAFTRPSHGAVSRLLSWAPLVWLGSISAEVYILQIPAGRIANFTLGPILGHYGVRTHLTDTLAVFAILLPLAYLINRHLTRRLTQGKRAENLEKSM